MSLMQVPIAEVKGCIIYGIKELKRTGNATGSLWLRDVNTRCLSELSACIYHRHTLN